MAANDSNSDDGMPASAWVPGPEQDALGLRLQAQRLLCEMFGISESTHLGRYEIMGEIGSGSMGVVYVAHDHELDRKVAIKTLRSSSDPELRQRLMEEARAMARVSHPNVVTVFDTDSAEGLIFIVMEYVEGVTVRAWLDTQRRPHAEILVVFAAAGEGLAAAHDKGVIHHDFKPANIMLGNDGHVRVLDFGLARADPGTDETIQYRAGDGLPDVVISGTPKYMAPEQFLGRWVDARSDQFAFCVSLYEALYEEHPYGVTRAQMWGAAERGELRSPRLGAQVPEWLRAIVIRGLAPDPDRRFESMRKLLVRLVAGDPNSAEQTERRSLRITFSLDYDLERIDDVERARLQDLLRIVTGDRDLAIEDIARGSIIVTINVTERGANRLFRLYEKRQLSGRLGIHVQRVEWVPRARHGALREVPAVGGAAAAVPTKETDFALLESWRAGDERAGQVLLSRHIGPLQQFFANRIGRDEGEDLTQETFLRLLSMVKERGLRETSFRSGLFGVARHTLYENLRRRYRRGNTDFDPMVDSIADHDGVSPLELIIENEHHRVLLECIRALPVESKQLLELYYWQDFSISELAVVFDVPGNTLRSRLRRARGLLRADMRQQLDVDEPETLDKELRELGKLFKSGPQEE